MADTPRTTERRDPAGAGYYVVMEIEPGRLWHVKGYDLRGTLLLHTSHTSRHSMETECDAWRSRGAWEKFNG